MKLLCFFALFACGLSLSARADEKSLFDGSSLTGWAGLDFWTVQDGCITGQTTKEKPTKGNTFLIWKGGEVGDFELTLQYKMEGGNSGIQYRSKVFDPTNWVVGGYQADMEAGPDYTGILYEERMRGILALRGQKVLLDKEGKKQVVGSVGAGAEIGAAIKKGDWNEYVIIAKGNRLQHIINGKQAVDVVDEDEAKRALSGVLALQLHAGPPMMAQFKNLRLRKL